MIAVSLTSAAFPAVNAQDRGPAITQLSESVFKSLDRDADGQLPQNKFLETLAERDRADEASTFETADADHDRKLSAKEFSELPAKTLFRLLDRDHNGDCSLAEIVPAPMPAVPPAPPLSPPSPWSVFRRRLAFDGVDVDRSAGISEAEFLKSRFTRSLAGNDPEGPIPDVVLEEVERALPVLLPENAATLVAEAWPQAQWDALGPDWATLAAHKPDGNGDGQISREEARKAVEIALGVRLADGTLIRLPEGFALKNVDFGYLDENKDQKLTQAEYIAKFQPSREVALENFAKLDQDKDGILTPAETLPLMRDDLVGTFLRYDSDRDGKVTPAEVAKHSELWEKNVIPGLFPGYDEDADGSLSYREFGWTPLQTRVVEWNKRRQDLNGDTKLSYDEFRATEDLFASVLSRRAFRLRDLDHDGLLSYEEYPFDMDLAKAPPQVAFELQDKDGSGELSHAELFTRKKPDDKDIPGTPDFHGRLIRSRRAFEAMDADHSGGLSKAEYLEGSYRSSLAGASTTEPIPDPVLQEAERVLGLLLGERKTLGSDDWKAIDWSSAGPDWTHVAQTNPDGDGDGSITADEVRRTIETALGIRRADGAVIRLPSGHLFKNLDLGYLDANHDNRLTQEEYVSLWQPDKVAAGKRFVEQMDRNKDGFATLDELVLSFREDLVMTFLRFDADRDDKIAPTEAAQHSASWEKTSVQGLFPGFDTDGDGGLSFVEFGWSPLANRVLDWNQKRRDLDGDARLSYEEFRPGPELFGSVLGRRYFRLRDLNRDGVLAYEEFPFDLDPAKAPPEIAFRIRDRNADGAWSFEELFTRERPKEDDRNALDGYHYVRLRTRVAFEASDADRNGTISLEEFRGSPAPQTLQGAGGQPVPDVVLEEVERALAVLLPGGAESLAADAWGGAKWDELGPDWKMLAEHRPDQDRDGQVSREEARRAIEIALGARLADGTRSRLPEGFAFKSVDFGYLDENKDGKLTQAEYIAKFQPSRDVALANFAKLDQDKDAILTPAEAMALMRDDLIGTFLRYDADRDGQVTRTEVDQQSAPWEKNVIPGLFPGFDENSDGSLSYREFGWTPMQTRVVDWNQRRRDLNDDTKLSYEEFRPSPDLFASVLVRRAFRLRDLSRDGVLTYDEFPFEVDARGLPKQIVFEQKDVNRDGQLEFLEAFPAARPQGPAVTTDSLRGYHARRTRCLLAFRASDLNSDDRLSADEFSKGVYALSSLGDVPSGPVPDPVLMLADKAVSAILPAGKDSLSRSEWKQAAWAAIGPDWIDLAKVDADRNRDGTITSDEARHAIEIALGIRLADGTLIRLPSGYAFKNVDFGYLDENKDRKLTEAEYIAKFQPSREVALKKFATLDQDKDNVLTPAELVGSMRDDLIGTWTLFDADFDGRVTPDEVATQSRPWEKNAIDGLFPGFDEDHNGNLSYEEFGLAPVQNRNLDWNRKRRDTDNDTYLSFEEFRDPDAGPFASVLSRRFFRLRDTSGDGRLSIDEFAFDMDVTKIPVEVAFKLQDKDKSDALSFAEIFAEAKPASSDKSAQERYEMRLAAAETRFLADDRDHDKNLSLAEFQQSREASLAAVERKTKALTRHRRTSGGDWFYPVVLTVNAIVLLGGGWYLYRRSS